METPPPQYVQYPRYGQGPYYPPGGPAAVRFSAIGEAWEFIRQDLGSWAVATLIFLAVSYAIAVPFSVVGVVLGGGLEPQDPPNLTLLVIGQVVAMLGNLGYFVMNAGFYSYALHRLQGGDNNYARMFDGFRFFLPAMGSGFLSWLAITIGILLCIVPGLFLTGALAFSPLLVIDRQMGAMESMRASLQVLKRSAFTMFLLYLVLSLIAGMGLLLCCVGMLFTVPIMYVAMAINYIGFFPPAQAEAPAGYAPPPASFDYGRPPEPPRG